MPAGSAEIALQPQAMDQAVLLSVAAATAAAVRLTNLLQRSLAWPVSAVQPQALRQRGAFLIVDAVARHRQASISVPL